MDINAFPTKRNLLNARHSLALARRGYDLLDKKRLVLMLELSAYKKSGKLLREDLHTAMKDARHILALAQMENITERIKSLCQFVPYDISISINSASMMGVSIPKIEITGKKPAILPYDIGKSTEALDKALKAWNETKLIILKLAEVDTAIYRINCHMLQAQRRASALKNITIPACEARIKYISEQLEERERDEMARVKMAKAPVFPLGE